MNKIRYYKNGDDVRTLKSSGNINMYEYVKIVEELSDDKDEKYLVKTSDGRESVFNVSELHCFGVEMFNNTVFDVESLNKINNVTVAYIREHITENVRSHSDSLFVLPRLLYTNLTEDVNYFKYKYREISDKEVIDILLNEILYGEQPYLSYSVKYSLDVNKELIKIDGCKGDYILPNEKKYTIAYKDKIVTINEISETNREIYKDIIDTNRFEDAILKIEIINMMSNIKKIIKDCPEVYDEFCKLKLKNKINIKDECIKY